MCWQEENGEEEQESGSESEEESSSEDEKVRDSFFPTFSCFNGCFIAMFLLARCLILIWCFPEMWWKSQKRNGVQGLIEIENPNRVSQKSKKAAEVDVEAPRELSRRERSFQTPRDSTGECSFCCDLGWLWFVYECVDRREEIEKQKAKERYMKLHLEGKTDQARADLARLAIIKKQREEAAKKREELRKGEFNTLCDLGIHVVY